MAHLAQGTSELGSVVSSGDEGPLLRIQRALLLLKSHLEMFRRRYAYHLRRWEISGVGVGSHAQLVGDKPGTAPLRVQIQPPGASFQDKVTLTLSSGDYVADLRAEVGDWWEREVEKKEKNATPVLGSLLSDGAGGVIRMITNGIELAAELDEKFLAEVPIKDLQVSG